MQNQPQIKQIKPKKCKNKACRTKFIPERPFITWCSPECGAELAKAKIEHSKELKAKKERKEYREAKEKIKSRSDWMREAQQAFNAYIRKRDENEECISSGVGNITYVSGKPRITSWDAGHYRSVGSSPALRFNELNVHKQSVHDNQHLHGNLIEYRKRLIERIGIDKVEWLEGPHEPKKYSVDDLKAIKAEYKLKLKELAK